MLKKKIKFDGLDGPMEEEFLFHLSKADLIEMEFNAGGGMADYLDRIAKSSDTKAIYQEFKKIVGMAIGFRTPEGAFSKTKEYRDQFLASEAFSELVVELLQSEQAAAQFIAGVIPSNLHSLTTATATPDNTSVEHPISRNAFEDSENLAKSAILDEVEPMTMTPEEAEKLPQDELVERFKNGWTVKKS